MTKPKPCNMRLSMPAFANLHFSKRNRSEGLFSADSVEKHCAASAESIALNTVQALFLSGFARLLLCRKDLC